MSLIQDERKTQSNKYEKNNTTEIKEKLNNKNKVRQKKIRNRYKFKILKETIYFQLRELKKYI